MLRELAEVLRICYELACCSSAVGSQPRDNDVFLSGERAIPARDERVVLTYLTYRGTRIRGPGRAPLRAGVSKDTYFCHAVLVAGVFELWYPGQEGGTAFGELLSGAKSPSGRLPISWEKKLSDNASISSYWFTDPKTEDIVYKEGVFVGYRGYRHNHTRGSRRQLRVS